MKNIIIAGAGHGGLVAAALLAKAGFNVTVYEKKQENELGYDQYDSVHLDGFELSGVPIPEAYKVKRTGITFMVPGTDLPPLKQGVSDNTYNVEIDRKALYRWLIALSIVYWQSGEYMLYADFARMGYAKSRTHSRRNRLGTWHTDRYLVWTEKGRKFLHEVFEKKEALA